MAAPVYDLAEFIDCCGRTPENIMLWEKAETDARNTFHLYTKPDLLEFINNNGLEDIEFINSKPLEKNPNFLVDAYHFMTGGIKGYIAFFKGKSNKWIIKSFHQSDEANTIGDALRKAGWRGILL